jgi:pyruvate,water dikinase
MTAVIDLAEATIDNAGPKMGRLGELIRAGVDVPGGFVIASAACQNELLREEMRGEIAAAYRRLSSDGSAPVVVRSSATDEDGSGASFAGIYNSYLGLVGVEEIIPAVQACCSALHSEQAVGYRERMGGDRSATSASMAVGVMLMVPAKSSGVAFTVDPVSGRDDRFVIEATWGFGEPVVQGVVTPDRIEVGAEDGRILRYEPGDKKVALMYQGGRMTRVELKRSKARTPALTPDEVEVLYERLCAVAAIAGHAVDCEWVIDESGHAWIVQWRAVTALPDNEELEWDPAEYAARYAFRSG